MFKKDNPMYKIPSLIIALLAITCQSYGQLLKELEKQIVAENNIKAKSQYDYKYNNGEPNNKGQLTSISKYDKKGNIIKAEYLDAKGNVIGWEKFEYDENGNRTLYERQSTSGKYKKMSQYDDDNQLEKEAGYNGAENFKNTYKYTSNGKIDLITYEVDNQIDEKRDYEYDGNKANVKIISKSGDLISKLKIIYDENDNILKEITLSTDNKELERKEYKYNSSNKVLEEVKTKNGSFYYKLIYKYNSKGDLISVSEENINEKLFVKKIYEYDGEGNMTVYKWRRRPADEFNSKKYTFNNDGVWLTEHTYYPKTKYEVLSKFKYKYY